MSQCLYIYINIYEVWSKSIGTVAIKRKLQHISLWYFNLLRSSPVPLKEQFLEYLFGDSELLPCHILLDFIDVLKSWKAAKSLGIFGIVRTGEYVIGQKQLHKQESLIETVWCDETATLYTHYFQSLLYTTELSEKVIT